MFVTDKSSGFSGGWIASKSTLARVDELVRASWVPRRRDFTHRHENISNGYRFLYIPVPLTWQ